MPRYKLIIEYDGSCFSGWQIQKGQPSIQQAVMDAVERFCGARVMVHGAGRTDAGVHALGQVAHIDLASDWPDVTVRDAINHHLKPDPIAILCAGRVDDAFDARFSAIGRHYLYRLAHRRAPLALDRGRVWRVPVWLDVEAMNVAARILIGQHDFTTFRAAACQARSPVKSLDRLDICRVGNEIAFHVSARSFMHNQVRSMVGALKLVGEGVWTATRLAAALAARDRRACAPVAPAHGLYLERVDYPDEFDCDARFSEK